MSILPPYGSLHPNTRLTCVTRYLDNRSSPAVMGRPSVCLNGTQPLTCWRCRRCSVSRYATWMTILPIVAAPRAIVQCCLACALCDRRHARAPNGVEKPLIKRFEDVGLEEAKTRRHAPCAPP